MPRTQAGIVLTCMAGFVLTCMDALMPRAHGSAGAAYNPLHFLHPWRSDALSENLLRSALSEGTGEAGAAPGEHFFGYFLVATRKYLAYPGETGLIDRRQRRHE